MTRLVAVIAAVATSVVIWIVAAAAGVAIEAPLGPEGNVQDISVWLVIVTAGLASFAGWGLLALLERFAAGKARVIWVVVAAAVFVLSLLGPLSAAGLAVSTRVVLLLMHVAVAVVLIPLFLRGGRVGVPAN
jgi:hypothetical protein